MGIFRLIESEIARQRVRLEAEAHVRARDFGQGRFFGWKQVAIVISIVLVSLALIFELLAPPRNVLEEVANTSLLQFRKGQVLFQSGENFPDFANMPGLEVEIPIIGLSKHPSFKRNGIWFRFRVDIPQSEFHFGQTAIMVPMIHGSSRIYVNSMLVSYGTDYRAIIPVTGRSNTITIFADTTQSSFPSPISGPYPIVVGNIDNLRSIEAMILENYQISPRSLITYALAIVLFGMLYVAFPRKPELLAYILFLAAAMGNSSVAALNDLNQAVFSNWYSQQALLFGLDSVQCIALLAFSLLFLREHPASVRSKIRDFSVATILIGPALTWLIYRWTGSKSLHFSGHFAINFGFLFLQSVNCFPRLIFLLRASEVPTSRKVAASLVVASIILVHSLNIAGYFFETVSPTAPYSNGLLLNIVLSLIVAFEVARAEVNQYLFSSMLPKEVTESVLLRKPGKDQSGFVILFDAVGFASNRERFEDATSRSDYIETLAHNMLGPVHELGLEGLSILNCTGDGLYCSIRGEPDRKTFDKVLELAKAVVYSKKDISGIRFRAAIGYGNYGVRVIASGSLRKEFVAGNVLNDLSRIIGSARGQSEIRILLNEGSTSFIRAESEEQVVDKHGFTHKYLPVENEKEAA